MLVSGRVFIHHPKRKHLRFGTEDWAFETRGFVQPREKKQSVGMSSSS